MVLRRARSIYEGHWKGLEIEIFWALKWLRAKRVPFGPCTVYTSRQSSALFHEEGWSRSALLLCALAKNSARVLVTNRLLYPEQMSAEKMAEFLRELSENGRLHTVGQQGPPSPAETRYIFVISLESR
jgi:hypothetical protein